MSVDLLDKPLLKGLIEKSIPFHELMNAYGINATIVNISSKIYGFIYVSRQGNIYIILNGNISYEMQRKALIHEFKHILIDVPKQSYFIGFNMQYEYIEKKADAIAKFMIRYIS